MGMADKIRSSKYTKHKDDLEANEAVGTVTNLSGGEGVEQMPWIDLRLTQKAMDHLWDGINNHSIPEVDARQTLAGNISKSVFIEDTNDWFMKTVLERFANYVYFKNWDTYYETYVSGIVPPPKFELFELWANFQKQTEFNPAHGHNGGIGFSFVVFMKIPTHWKEQHALPFGNNTNGPCASDFQFLLGRGREVQPISIPLCSDDEGRMLFFPSWLVHQVYPFFGTDEERVTISGNIAKTEDIGRQIPIPEWRMKLKTDLDGARETRLKAEREHIDMHEAKYGQLGGPIREQGGGAIRVGMRSVSSENNGE